MAELDLTEVKEATVANATSTCDKRHCKEMRKDKLPPYLRDRERILYPRNTRALPKTPVIGGQPIEEETCMALRKVVFGSCASPPKVEWARTGLTLRPYGQSLAFGLRTPRNTTRGLVTAVQAVMLKHFLFKCDRQDVGPEILLKPSYDRQIEVLTSAISEIIWRCAGGFSVSTCPNVVSNIVPRAIVALPQDTPYLQHSLHLFEFNSLEDLEIFIKRYLYLFHDEGGPGAKLLLYSAVLSRGLSKIRNDLEDPKASILGGCSEEGPISIIIFVLTGRASPHLHNGVLHVGDENTYEFIIPVNIRVTDANDNTPQFVNAPYVLNISEVTVVGTRVLQGVRAVDADQPGPYSTVQYTVLPGAHSDYFIFVNALEGTLVLRKSLDYETLTNFSVDIRAQDQGNPPRLSTTTLHVNVIDADDQNPAFLHDQYKVTVPRHIKEKKSLRVVPAAIKAVDQDVGINAPVRYTIQGGILPFLDLNPETAEIVMTRSLQDHELMTPATIVIKATQVNNADRYALATVIVSREDMVGPTAGGRLPVKFVLKNHQTSVPENTPSGSVLLTAGVNKADPNLKFWLVGPVEDLERFSITNSGELILNGNLDYERRFQHSFLIHVTDGYHNDTSHVNVSVEDVNEWEPRFQYSRYEFHAHSAREGSVVGKLEAADGDRGDKVNLSLRGQDARSFEIRDNGELVLRSLGLFNGSLARFIAVATDSGKPPRSSMIPVIVHIPNAGSLPIAARAAPAWLGSSVLLVAIFGAVLGLLGVVILILILYIYKHKRPKSGGSVSSVGTGYREKSPVPSALSPTPQVLGANVLQDGLEVPRNRHHDIDDENDNVDSRNEIDNPVFGETNESSYSTTIKSIASARQLPLYTRHKVAPAPNPPALSATSNIPNIGGLVQNMNDLSARTNLDAGSHDSSNYSGDPPDSLVPAWPASSALPRIKKLSWDDDDRTVDSVEIAAETRTGDNQVGNERLNLTVYF
ncbi:Protocadherin Fat 4 [Trachymyrmex zeteki]|uniref:Protocadherin Fat 4 n=1 Tax=Mycetomoellerius zeteki TaxID=64791 RepID=A0A151XBI3_9HYME|nr:Protocadherin Fat 4 [Trachymyrmex zeteki]